MPSGHYIRQHRPRERKIEHVTLQKTGYDDMSLLGNSPAGMFMHDQLIRKGRMLRSLKEYPQSARGDREI